MPIPRLLVFDLDGTLIDSSLDLCNSVNAALGHVGKPALPNTLIAEANALTGSNITPAETLMIGDSDVDVLTARRAGARSLGCTFGLAPHALAAAEPDSLAHHPSDWLAAITL